MTLDYWWMIDRSLGYNMCSSTCWLCMHWPSIFTAIKKVVGVKAKVEDLLKSSTPIIMRETIYRFGAKVQNLIRHFDDDHPLVWNSTLVTSRKSSQLLTTPASTTRGPAANMDMLMEFLPWWWASSTSRRAETRLAASVLKCGQGKIWLDPNEINEISLANSRRNIARLERDGYIVKKPTVVHSRARVTLRNEAKRKGRHTGECCSCVMLIMNDECVS